MKKFTSKFLVRVIVAFICLSFTSTLLAQDGYVRLENRWKKTYVNNQSGALALGAIQPGWWSAMWTLEKVGSTNYVRIKNRWTGTYIHTQDGLGIGTIQPGWLSAMWTLERVEGTIYVRIKNRWKGTYLLNQNGPLAVGTIQPGWWSAMWTVGLSKVNSNASEAGISMIMASDSQWAWTAKTDAGISQTESVKESDATTLNNNHVKSMNSLISSAGNVKGVIINGDLTAYGHSSQFDKFKSIYAKLNVPKYLGLGNHDYANNVNNTYENNAANRMVNFMVSHIKGNGASNYDFKVSDSYEFPNLITTTSGSLSYSWNIGKIHFIQLHNYPMYKRNWSNYVSIGTAKRRTVKITSAMSWLASDLAKARNAGDIIIINFHDSDQHWGDFYSSSELTTMSNQFRDMLSLYKVGAVFVGHYHTWLGKRTPPNRAAAYGNTPVFYCGSASQSKYLLVNFIGDQMTVENVSSLNGTAVKSNKQSYTVFNKVESVAVPNEDGWVTFFNEAGYVAKYSLSYTINGETKSYKTGNLALGNKRRYTIPGNAKNIKIKGQGKTGLVWEMWRTTFSKSYNGPPNKCFKSYGTTLNQKWNNNCK